MTIPSKWPGAIRVTPNSVAKLVRARFLRSGESLSAPTLVKVNRVEATEDAAVEAQQTHGDPARAADTFERQVNRLVEKIVQNKRFTPLVVYQEDSYVMGPSGWVKTGRGFAVYDGHHRLAAVKMLQAMAPGEFSHIWVQWVLDAHGAPQARP